MGIFELTPFDDLYSDDLIIESFDYKSFYESLQGTTKRNIFQRLWDVIKRIFKWLVTNLGRALDYIKSLLRSKPKSAEQLADLVGFKPTDITNHDDIKSALKQLTIKFEDDGKLTFTAKKILSDNWNKKTEIPGLMGLGYTPRNSKVLWGLVFSVLKTPQFLDRVTELFKYLVDGNKASFLETSARFTEFITRIAQGVVMPFPYFTTSLDELVEFQKKLNALNYIVTEFDNPDLIIKRKFLIGELVVTEFLNGLAHVSINLQMGLNAIFHSLNEVYKLDDTYKGVAKTPEDLSKFANICIYSGFPGKYVAANLFVVASNELKGDYNTPNDPIAGQFRVVFKPIPKGQPQYVLKVATSQVGIRSNRNEIRFTNLMIKTNGHNMIARVIESFENATGITMQYADPVKLNTAELDEFKKQLTDHLKDKNLGITIGDLHSSNIGRVNGNIVAIDYGDFHKVATYGDYQVT